MALVILFAYSTVPSYALSARVELHAVIYKWYSNFYYNKGECIIIFRKTLRNVATWIEGDN